MEMQETGRVITLSDIWEVFVRHIIPIILAAILCVSALFAYTNIFVTPKYNSTATLYVLKQDKTNDYVYTQSDFTLALNIVNDCAYMLKSHAVLDSAIYELGLDMSYNELYGSISTSNPDNTRVLEVSVKTDSNTEAKRIVDCICRIASEKITAAMGMDQVNIYASGTMEDKPCNTMSMSKYVIAGIAGAILMYAVYLIAFMLDDKIKSEEDVAKYLGLSVLGEIPNSNASKRKKSKYYSYYSSDSKKRR